MRIASAFAVSSFVCSRCTGQIYASKCCGTSVAGCKLKPQQKFGIINGGSGQGTSVADIAGEIVRNWGSATRVQFSGAARSGDPVSLLADDTALRAAGFNWRIPLGRGIRDYVNWFKGQVRG